MARKTTKPRLTPEQRAERDQQTRDKVDALHEALNARIAATSADPAWRAMLRTAVTLSVARYSANNIALLWAQAEEKGITLSRVAGFHTWKRHNRSVMKGQKGMAVVAPRPFTVRENGEPVIDPDTGQAKRGVRFGLEYVWDVSQTDGEPLPELVNPLAQVTGGAPAGLWDALLELAGLAGFTVHIVELRPGNDGRVDYEEHRIEIADGLPEAERVRALAHEIGHVRAEHETRRDAQGITKQQRETEADSIAAVVCGAMGLDVLESSAFYVASWSGGKPELIRAAFERVQSTSRAMLDDLARVLGIDDDGDGEQEGETAADDAA